MNRLLPIMVICVLTASCTSKPPPAPPNDAPLAGPGEFRVLPDGRLVVEKPVRNP